MSRTGARFRVERGAFRPRGMVWEKLAMGSTNGLWRGRGRGRGRDGDWLLKWYKHPMPGIHPEAEVAKYLSGIAGVGVAEFGASLEERTENGGWRTVGLVQRWIAGVSGWDRLLGEMRGAGPDFGRVEDWGRTVGRLHRALSSGGAGSCFSVEDWGEPDREMWKRRVEGLGVALLEEIRKGRPQECELGVWKRLCGFWEEREAEWRLRVEALAGVCAEGTKSRVHGDLHLGQILDCGDGRVVVVDFEGEPLRPLEERRRKDLPLRDVAGMWRSFAYAGAVSGTGDRWVADLQRAFLAGWRAEMELPRGDWEGLLEGLVWEKAIYEVLYELRHRPDWVWVPISGISLI